MLKSLSIEHVIVRRFRNIDHLEMDLGARFNVISGDNGQGKTNLLEALYVLATSKSFRTSKLSEVVSFGAQLSSVRARVVEDGASRSQSVGLGGGARLVKLDEKRPANLFAYAVRTPVVVFHPGELSLSMGASSERRRLLDRAALFISGSAMADLANYTRALRARQRTLETRGVSSRELSDWEELCVRHGLAVMDHRARAGALLSAGAVAAFRRISASGIDLSVEYAPGAPLDATAFLAALARGRTSDLRRGSSSIGPHRDDLALRVGGHPARGSASQGQHRAVTLSLKVAELDVIGGARGVRPVLLLDDVSSELDRDRTAALFSLLQDHVGQVVLTTTRPELIDTGSDSLRRDFAMRSGSLSQVGAMAEG